MSSFQAHDRLIIDCNVKAKQAWLRSSFKAHKRLIIDCDVIVEQTWLMIGFEAHNLLRVDFTVFMCEGRCTLKRHLNNVYIL